MKRTDMIYKLPESYTEDRLHKFLNGFTFLPNGFGHQFNDATACCGDRIIGDFELIYVIGGISTITVEGTEYKLQKGDVVLIPPFAKHRITTEEMNPHDNYWIHFDVYPFYRQSAFINAMLPNKSNKLCVGIGGRLQQLYKTLDEEMNNREEGYKTFFASILSQIVTLLLRGHGSRGLATDLDNLESFSSEKVIVDRSIEYIFQNLSGDIRIEDISSCLHVSESYVYKAFDKVLKIPPNQFIQFMKMKRAEVLIKTSNLSFKEISDMLGFSSPYYFSNVFKKYFGVSPKVYSENINL